MRVCDHCMSPDRVVHVVLVERPVTRSSEKDLQQSELCAACRSLARILFEDDDVIDAEIEDDDA